MLYYRVRPDLAITYLVILCLISVFYYVPQSVPWLLSILLSNLSCYSLIIVNRGSFQLFSEAGYLLFLWLCLTGGLECSKSTGFGISRPRIQIPSLPCTGSKSLNKLLNSEPQVFLFVLHRIVCLNEMMYMKCLSIVFGT